MTLTTFIPMEPSQFGDPVWQNNRYTVTGREVARVDEGVVVHLSIKRIDKKPIRNWRDLLWIKNQFHPESWALEIYPPMSELVDTSNQYHLWVYPPGCPMPDYAFQDGQVIADGDGTTEPGKVRQQPIPEWYPEPLSEDEIKRRIEQHMETKRAKLK